MSRLQPSTSSESPLSASAPGDSPSNRGYVSERPSSSTHPRVSEGSEGYPSWLPSRPPPPAPASTFHSSVGMFEPPPPETFSGGRKATPRSVRVVSLQDTAQPGANPYHRRDATDHTALSNPLRPRVWSRATTAGLSGTLISQAVNTQERLQAPKFRSTGLHPELLRNPSILARLYFCLLPIMTFYHIPLQTFFDFNAVFILLQVARYPNPSAPGVPGSGKNWALGAAAYIACWLAWIAMVFVLYDLVYSFWRRWRVKRPLITPLYFSSSAFNLTCMTSYTNFCFMQYIRFSAFFGENGSLRDGIAETFWFYSQNLPTVALLLPRAGLSLTLLFAFTSASPDYVAMLEAGLNLRDATYFRASDGTLTDYARGVLIANAAWTAWRVLVLLLSWIGLWILSGQGCAGLCGPRYRWEEDHEKSMPNHSDGASETDALLWSWRICTRLRIQEAYDFCLTVKPPARWSGTAKKEDPGLLGVETSPPFEVEQVLAAVGFPSAPPPARRGALSEDLFSYPREESGEAPAPPPELSEIIPKVVKRSSKDKEMTGPSAPLLKLPYPFAAYSAQVSSKDQIPFPPSPGSRKEKRRSPITSGSEHPGQDDEEDEDTDDDDDDEEAGEVEIEVEENSEAQPRTSGSMSSLGQPVMSRYPFQLRRPARGGSVSSAPGTHSTPRTHASTNTRSTESRASHSTQSTGNRDTSSESPNSHEGMSSPGSGYGSPIPMPPRHPQPGRGRARAGTVPSVLSSSPSPIVYTGRGASTRIRVDSGQTETFSGGGYESFLSEEVDDEAGVEGEEEDEDEDNEDDDEEPQMMEQPVPEGPHEAAEGEDSVGLLSVGPRSPKSSMVSSRRRRGHHSDSGRSQSGRSRSDSRSGSLSGSSRSRAGSAVRSRAQSLIQSIGAASRSSLDLVQTMRSRANSSMARLEEDMVSSSDSRSRSGSEGVHSSNENYTFGVRPHVGQSSGSRLREAPSNPSFFAPSISAPSEATTSHLTARPTSCERGLRRLDIPTRPYGMQSDDSRPDISTAAQSFITAPATLAGSSVSGEPVPASWQEASHMFDRPGTEWRPA
ncbi:uncharacterized protein EDB91DRAFT_1060049 [Suillus paluster]|uniref:uncharacterized protein n=1 Tax=Suillus paluster TaxID=48578 RepID=UPI001B862BCA|nr:uncharacterized protein EDB91DRAFT_1060049 [Suillus paluster]KAG1729358.1 hypothetical protein EDB91DRAFT_1060049 [Suillus paluster]